MTDWRRTRTIIAAAATLAAAVALPRVAEAHGRGGYHGGPPVVFRGYYGFGGYPYFGLGYGPFFGPYWGPYAYGPPGGVDMSAAFVAGWGAVDINAKPGEAEVWVDGKYKAEAKDLDGYPSFLWLPEGAHRVVIYKGGYASFDEPIEVQRGLRRELKVRLEKGVSESPGQKPGAKPSDKPADKPGKSI